MVYQPHGAHNLRHNGAPPPGVRAQLRLQRQLSTRVPLWHQLEELEGLGLGGPEGLDTALSEPPNSIPSDPGTPLSVAAAAGPARAPELPERAGTAAGALPLPLQPPDALGARRNPRRQLALLQEALCPLTHCDGDLQPHAQPKAQELYQMLLQGAPPAPWYMINPDGWFRFCWDILMLVLTAAYMIWIPVLIAFHAPATECTYFGGATPPSVPEAHAPPQSARSMRFYSFANAAFLLDIPLNFLTGVRRFNKETGMVEYSYSFVKVAAAYSRSWLLLDVAACLPLECILVAAGRAKNFNAGSINRLLRVFGIRRRAHGDPFRIINLLPFLAKNFNYSTRLVVISASWLLLGLHYFACLLWLILRVQDFPPNTWPAQLGLLEHVDVSECWTWSVFAVTSAMIGLGYGSYPPVTYMEAQLWIAEMIVMAAGWATVNGFVLSAILEFLANRAKYKTKLLQAQREVERRGLPPALAHRVMAFFKFKHHGDNTQDGGAVTQELPPALRLQVAMASVGGALHRIPVLRESRQLLQRVALLVEHQVAAEGQIIMIPGTPLTQMCFLTKGYADVYMKDVLIDTLTAGDSFGEPALLPVPPIAELPPRLRAVWGGSSDFSTRRWPCLFTVRALSACALVTLDAGAFAALLQEYEWAEEQLQQLGRRHAAVLDALPILEEVWAAAAAADPLHDPAAAAQGSASHRAKDGKRAEKGGEGAGGQGAGADRSKASLYERAARALARPEGRAGVRPWDLSGRARGRRRGGEGGGSGGDYGGGGGGGADVGPGAHV